MKISINSLVITINGINPATYIFCEAQVVITDNLYFMFFIAEEG